MASQKIRIKELVIFLEHNWLKLISAGCAIACVYILYHVAVIAPREQQRIRDTAEAKRAADRTACLSRVEAGYIKAWNSICTLQPDTTKYCARVLKADVADDPALGAIVQERYPFPEGAFEKYSNLRNAGLAAQAQAMIDLIGDDAETEAMVAVLVNVEKAVSDCTCTQLPRRLVDDLNEGRDRADTTCRLDN